MREVGQALLRVDPAFSAAKFAARQATCAQDTTRIRPDLTGKLPVVGVILIHPAVA